MFYHNDTRSSGQGYECGHCYEAVEDNPHTKYASLQDDIRKQYNWKIAEILRARLDKILDEAVNKVVEHDDYEITCWCGHSLHYSDCPSQGTCHLSYDPHAGACLKRWKKIAHIS